jgi:hypothetical protein
LTAREDDIVWLRALQDRAESAAEGVRPAVHRALPGVVRAQAIR